MMRSRQILRKLLDGPIVCTARKSKGVTFASRSPSAR